MSWDLRCGASAYARSLQGYFSPVVVKYASSHQEKIANLILVNPPVCSVYISTIHFFFLCHTDSWIEYAKHDMWMKI